MTINLTPATANPENLTHPKYRPDIDGLRAVAILTVVGFHAFPFWIKGGFIGVDIFFVISGYLISRIIFGSLEQNKFSFAAFYIRRIKRIFPALLLVLISSFVFGWFTLLVDEYKQLGKHIAGGAGFISNLILLNESGYFDNVPETKPLLHLWSLGVEEQFYIVWPLLLWFAWKQRLNLLSIAVAVGFISFALNVSEARNGTGSAVAFYSPQTRFWELMVGSVLAYVTMHKHNVLAKFKLDAWLGKMIHAPEAGSDVRRNTQSVLGAVMIAVGVIVITKEREFPGWWALLPTMGAVLIISASSQAWLNRVVLSSRILVWFGLISFPLYLWHWPLLSFARLVEGELPAREVRISVVLISIVLAWLTYRLIERPIRFGEYGKVKAIVLSVLMVVIGCVGYYCYDRDGLGFRLPKELQVLTWTKQEDDALDAEWRGGSCFLHPEQDYKNFDACESKPEDENKPSILLWGDSHAAHLYPGYKASFGQKYKIIQRTASTCPPILDLEIDVRPYCKAINDHILGLIRKEKPDRVVLAAKWIVYDWQKVGATIIELQKMGVKKIDLIGSVPQWKDSLYKQLYFKYQSDKNHQLPHRMSFGLNKDFNKLDLLLFDLSARLGVNYISPAKILCNEFGCITRFGETSDTLEAFDAEHLTSVSSRYLVARFPKD